MKNQLFKTLIDTTLLWGFLKENGEEQSDYYILSKPLYKNELKNINNNPV